MERERSLLCLLLPILGLQPIEEGNEVVGNLIEVLVSRLLRRQLRSGTLAEPLGDLGSEISERTIEKVVRPIVAELRVERVDRAGVISLEGEAGTGPEMSLGNGDHVHRNDIREIAQALDLIEP